MRPRTARSALPLLLLLLPAVLLAALGPRYGGELTIGVCELPPTLDPGAAPGDGARLLTGLVGEVLVRTGPDGIPSPSLAQSWAVSAGGQEWTLTLHPGARFHDGAALTSEAAVRSLRRFLRGRGAAAASLAESLEGGLAFRSGAKEDLPGLAASDPQRIVLRLGGPRALPLLPLTSPAAAITSPPGAGGGPFVPTLVLPGRRIGLTAFGGHVRGRPYLDRLEVVAFPDQAALHTALEAGKVDLAPGEPGLSALAATLLLRLDPARAPFDRREARAAVSAAIDRVELVGKLIPGGDAAPFLLVPGLLPALGASPPARGAGIPPGPLTMAVGADVPPLLSQRVVAHLAALGFGVQVVPARPANLAGVPAGGRLFLFSPEVAEAGLALEELYALSPPLPAVRALLDAAARETDLDRRRVILYRAEALLREDNVLIPLASVPVTLRGRTGVHGLGLDLGGRPSLEDAWVEP